MGQSVCFSLVFFRKKPGGSYYPPAAPLTSHPPPYSVPQHLGMRLSPKLLCQRLGVGRWGSRQTCCNWSQTIRLSVTATSSICHHGEKPQRDLIFTLFPQTAPSPWSLSRDFTHMHHSLLPIPYYFLTSFNLMLCIKEPSIQLCFHCSGENILSFLLVFQVEGKDNTNSRTDDKN